MSWSPHEHGYASPLSRLGRRLVQGGETVVAGLARAVRAVAFWAAVGLPFVYLPLVVSGVSGQQWLALGGLLLANAVALVAGHAHARNPTA